jgi:hypothetical protein
MFGDAWSNPLFFTFNSPSGIAVVHNSYFDLDGGLWEAFDVSQVELYDCQIFAKQFEYYVWLDHGNQCCEESQAK